jgi:hypothetical protein
MRLLLFTFLLSALSFGQDRNGISYQALIINPNVEQLPGQDNDHSPLTNTDICLQFHIINSSGNYEYSESQSVTTDAYGMVNLVIGTGTPIGAITWDAVAWSAEAKSLKVDLDTTGACTSFTELSNQQLTSVPFALYSPSSNVPGPKGDPGDPGADGDSAYQVWLDEGNTGTEQDFLDALKGTNGTPGADGDSAYQVWLDEGNTGTEQEFLESLKGADGDPGEGTEGKSAYDIWIELGNTGSEQDFIDSLVGPQGEPGQDGQNNAGVIENCLDVTPVPVPRVGWNEGTQPTTGEFRFVDSVNDQSGVLELQTLNSKKLNLTLSFERTNHTDGNSSIIFEFFDSNNNPINSTVEISEFKSSGGGSSSHSFALVKDFITSQKFEIYPESTWSTTNYQKSLDYDIEINSSIGIAKLKVTYNYKAWSTNQGVPQMHGFLSVYTYQSCNNTSVTPPTTLQVGDEWGGGIVFYIAQPGDPIYVEGEIHGLIAPKNFVAGGGPSNPNTAWKYSPYKEMYEQIKNSSLYQIGDGLETTNLINQTYLLNRPSELDNDLNAWVFASKSNLNGYNDWYIPNGIELGKLLIYAGVTNCSNSIDGDNIIGKNMVQGMYINSGTYYNSIGKVLIGCIQVSDCSGQCYSSKFYMIRRF